MSQDITPAQNGAYAQFADQEAARLAVKRLEDAGVPLSRILVSEHAPDQSGTPIDTKVRDKQTMSNLWRLGSKGAVLGFIGGAILGAATGMLVWGAGSPVWILLAVGFAVFGIGLGLLWSFMLGKGESTHMGTVYDEPAADEPTTIVVRCDDAAEAERHLETLASAGGTNLRQVPPSVDRPKR